MCDYTTPGDESYWTLVLLHTSSQHLIGRNEHDADDERNGEGTNQAFPHAGVLHLLCWACCEEMERGYIRTPTTHISYLRSSYWNLSYILSINGELDPRALSLKSALRFYGSFWGCRTTGSPITLLQLRFTKPRTGVSH